MEVMKAIHLGFKSASGLMINLHRSVLISMNMSKEEKLAGAVPEQ